MDKLKDMAGKATGGGSGGAKKTEGAAGGQQDYGDKAFTAGEQKFGIAPNKERDEKITDKARTLFESKTGKNVPDKFSN